MFIRGERELSFQFPQINTFLTSSAVTCDCAKVIYPSLPGFSTFFPFNIITVHTSFCQERFCIVFLYLGALKSVYILVKSFHLFFSLYWMRAFPHPELPSLCVHQVSDSQSNLPANWKMHLVSWTFPIIIFLELGPIFIRYWADIAQGRCHFNFLDIVRLTKWQGQIRN